jgi:hypothetical protein
MKKLYSVYKELNLWKVILPCGIKTFRTQKKAKAIANLWKMKKLI